MTPLQSACLKAIKAMTKDGVSPSYDQLATRLNLSGRSQVHRIVTALKAQGRVESLPNAKRSLIVVDAPPELSSMSLAGLKTLAVNVQAEITARTQGRG